MIRVTVQVTNLSGERYWAYDSQLPAQVQIGVNINIVGLDQKGELAAEAPFVFTVTYAPSIAQLSVKGKALVNGEKSMGLPTEQPQQGLKRSESRYTT